MLHYWFSRPFIYIFLLLFTASVISIITHLRPEFVDLLLCCSGAFLILTYFRIPESIKLLLLFLSLFLIFCYRIFDFQNSAEKHYHQLPDYLNGAYTLKILDNTSYANRRVITAQLKYLDLEVKTQITDWDHFLPENALYGDVIHLNLRLRKVQFPINRYINPYDHYLLQQQIYYQSLPADSTYFLKQAIGFSLIRIAQSLSKYLKHIFEQHSASSESTQLMCGILLGDKSGMDKSLKEAFRLGGISHILAVSGMHLGFFYFIIVCILKQLRKWKWNIPYTIEFCLILFCIWGYTLLTGLGIAVCRAAIMVSLFQLGKLFKRKTQAINILFAVASIMVFIQPQTLFDIGFQLSCLALVGIFWLSKYTDRILFPSTVAGKYIWSVCSVSLSVQLIITPVCLYHFHTFPLYFLFTNLVWAPVTPVIMVCGLTSWLFHWLSPFAADTLMQITDLLIRYSLKALHFLNSLPFANIDKLWIEAEDCIVYLMILILFGMFLETKRIVYSSALFGVLVMGSIHYYIREKNIHQKNELLIIPVKNKTEFMILTRGLCFSSSLPSRVLETYLNRKHIHGIFQKPKSFLKELLFCNDSILYITPKGNKFHSSKISSIPLNTLNSFYEE